MEQGVSLQLEALKLLQHWSIWLISLATAFLGLMTVAFKDLADPREVASARVCLVFLILTVLFAVMLVGAIPAQVQKLQGEIVDNPLPFGANARGIYGSVYLGFIPLWALVSSQRVCFFIALLFGARLIWLRIC